jgi:hypothetical protein
VTTRGLLVCDVGVDVLTIDWIKSAKQAQTRTFVNRRRRNKEKSSVL